MIPPSPPVVPRPAQIQDLAPVRSVRAPHWARPGRPDTHGGRPGERAADSSPPPAGTSPLKALTGVLLLLPLLLVPLAVLWFAGRPVLVEHSRLARYREVTAVIVQAGLERRPGATPHRAPAFVPRVTYRYTVGGEVYLADRVTPLDVSGTEGWARKHLAPYRPGDAVIAYYDPRSPGRAFLERPATGTLTATFFLPVPLLALALLWAARVRRKQQRAAAARTRLRLVG